MTSSLTRDSSIGVIWLLLQSLAGRVIGFLGQIALAWLLLPSDFGDIGLAYSITSIIGTLVGFGIDDVLQSRPRTLRMWATPAFWVCLVISFGGSLIMLAGAWLGAAAYKSPRIFGLVAVLALSTPLSALSMVPGVVLRANFRFGFLAAYTTIELLATQLVTILLAWKGMGAYSFVIPVALMAVVKAVVFWRSAGLTLKWKFRISLLKHTFGRGLTVFAQKLITAVRNNGDYIVLGLLASHDAVGFYFFAFKLATVPVYTLATSLTSVLFPALTQLKAAPARQRAASLSASRVITVVTIPLCFLQAAVAAPLLHLLFGAKWTASVPIFQILSVGMAFDVVPCVAGALLNANGRFRTQLLWAALSLPLFLMLIVMGGLIGSAKGVATGVTLFFILIAPIYSYYALRSVGCSVREVLGIFAMPVLCASAAALSAVGVAQWERVMNHDFAEVCLITLWMLSVYLLLIKLSAPQIVAETIDKLKVVMSIEPSREMPYSDKVPTMKLS